MRIFTLLLAMAIAVGCKKGGGGDVVIPPPPVDDTVIYGVIFIYDSDIKSDWLRDTVDIRFWTNEAWQFTVDSADMDWLSVDRVSGIADSSDITVKLSIGENPLFEERSGVININDLPSITVIQGASRRQLDDLNREEL